MNGGEANFLQVEVKYLMKSFERVLIVPEKCEGQSFDKDVETNTHYAETLSSKKIFSLFWLAISSKIFYHGIAEKNFPLFSITAWRRLIAFAGKAEFTRRWVLNWLHKENLDGSDCIFYTYWFDQAAAGIAFAKEDFPKIKLVSRAHGYDIYEEKYYSPAFFPCRESVLPLIDRLFPDSQAGLAYLNIRYPDFSSRYEVSLLGVSDPEFITQSSTDGVFRIVSCSMIRPEKRIGLLLQCFLHASKSRPNQKFEWFHFGNGKDREQLQKFADELLPPNAKAYFPGYSDPETLMKFYREKPFDVFVNISETEGTPVSIMEAISCGMPVIATAVGGNKEIVSVENGILLSINPTVEEVASAFFYLIDNAKEAASKRKESRSVWQRKYNADKNFYLFAEKLKSMLTENRR